MQPAMQPAMDHLYSGGAQPPTGMLPTQTTVHILCSTMIVCIGARNLITWLHQQLPPKYCPNAIKTLQRGSLLQVAIAALTCSVSIQPNNRHHFSNTVVTWIPWGFVFAQICSTYLERNHASRFRAAMRGAVCSILLILPAAHPDAYTNNPAIRWLNILVPTLLVCGFLSVPRQADSFSEGRPVDRQHTGSLLEVVTFSWARRSLDPSKLKSATITDLPSLRANLRAENLSENIRAKTQKSERLVMLLARAHAFPLLLQWILSVLQSFLFLVPHSITYRLLEWLSDGPERSGNCGFGLALLLGAAVIAEVLVESWLKWISTSMIKLPIEATLNSMVYRKALLLPNTSHDSRRKLRGGFVVSEMRIYSARASILYANGHLVLASLTNLVSTTVLLVTQVGWTGLALGILATLLVVPITSLISNKYNISVKEKAKFYEKRQALLTEALLAIRQIKISAFEGYWKKKISQVRDEELKQLLISGAWMTILVFAANMSPTILSGVPLYIYYLQGRKISAAVAFTSIRLFSQLQDALSMLPIRTPPIWEALGYLDRIEDFLNRNELDETGIAAASSISTNKAVATWYGDGIAQFTLEDLSIIFPAGELSIVTGSTGSGKSLLLAAISGEAKIVSGKVYRPCINSTIENNSDRWMASNQMAIVSQTPWMDDVTIRENILFGLPLDPERYNETLYCCALDKDLGNLKDGDATRVGIKGVALSGGQRWRISLARALYSRAQYIVLDDVLSAVDTEVRQWIVEKALTGDLATGRTRILVTHHETQCADKSAYRVHLSQGRAKVTSHASMASCSSKDEKVRPRSAKSRQSDGARGMSCDSALKAQENGQSSEPLGKSKYLRYFNASGGAKSWAFALVVTGVREFVQLRKSRQLKEWASSSDQLESSKSSHGTTYMLLATLRCLVLAATNPVWYGIGLNASQRLFNGMTSSIFGTPLQWLEEASHGEILLRFGSEMNTVDNRLPHHASFMVDCLAGFCCVLATNASSSVYDIVLIALLCHLYLRIGTKLVSATRVINSLSLKASSSLQQHLSALQAPDGIMTVRVYGMSAKFINRMHRLIDDTSIALWHSTLCDSMANIQLGAVGALFVTASALSLVLTSADAGTAGIALSFAMEFRTEITGFLQRINVVESAMQNFERIAEYGDLPQEPTSGTDVPDSWPAQGGIKFDGVTAAYHPNSADVLKALSFSVNPGERVGVVGRTGAGKSSLTLALTRLIGVRKGRILIDGVDISTVKLHVLRRRVLVIPQDPYLFRGTLRSLLDPDKNYDDHELLGSLKRVQCGDHSCQGALPLSDLSFMIEDGGRNISQGQRQILYLAKALLTRKRIIVMDEATSAVDLETDATMQTAIRQGLANTTVVVIAHRLATIADFDKVLVLEEGRAVEFGSPIDLYRREGMFWKLVQHSSEREDLVKKILDCPTISSN